MMSRAISTPLTSCLSFFRACVSTNEIINTNATISTTTNRVLKEPTFPENSRSANLYEEAIVTNSFELTSLLPTKEENVRLLPTTIDVSASAKEGSIPYFSEEAAIVVHRPKRPMAFCYDHLTPNETDPQKISKWLGDIRENSVFITTGPERPFFHAASVCLEHPNFQGCVVIKDINPKVYHYNNTVMLLLRLACDHEHFIHLASVIKKGSPQEYDTRLKEIRQLLVENQEISSEMREHYEKNLETMCKLYLLASGCWRTCPGFEERNYHLSKNKELFLSLQKLAKAGRILPTIGPIDDLEFLFKYFDKKMISVIDISNIPQYTTLLKFPIEALVISTIGTGEFKSTIYEACKWVPLSKKEEKEFETLHKIIMEAIEAPDKETCLQDFREMSLTLSGYNLPTLEIMRKIKEKCIPFSYGWEYGPHLSKSKRLHDVDLKTFRKNIAAHQNQLAPFGVEIATPWPYWEKDPERYFVFSDLPGWRKVFVEQLENPNFHEFLKKADRYIPNEIRQMMLDQKVWGSNPYGWPRFYSRKTLPEPHKYYM